jgi:hypothetical protein
VTVVFLNGNKVLPVGTLLDFGGGKVARLSAPYYSGANITVDAIPTALVQNDVATYFDPGDAGKKKLVAGTVLSLEMSAVKTAVAAAVAGNTGNATIAVSAVAGTAEQGVYRLTVVEPGTNLGNIAVEAPDGTTIGDAIVGTAATVGGITFTVTDGSTDAAVGDQFTIEIVVSEAVKSDKVVPRSLGRGDSIGILETEAVEDDPSASLSGHGVLVGGVLWENNLPDAVSGELNEDWKDELNRSGTGFAFQAYADNRTSQALA